MGVLARHVALLCTLVSIAGCDGRSGVLRPAPAEVVVLRVGEQSTTEDGILGIGFLAVLDDSRCPIDVTCPWEGNGRLSLELSVAGGAPVVRELNTSRDPQIITFAGREIQIVGLNPEPVSTAPIPPGGYEVTLQIRPPSS